MAILAVGENDAGDECSECGGEADQLHNERDAYNEEQGGGGEEFADLRAGNGAEERVDEVATGEHYAADCS